MATTTLAAILEAWETVLEAPPRNLRPAQQPFSHDRQPAGLVADSYCLEDGGQVRRDTVTSNQEVRIDRIRLLVAKPIAFAGRSQHRALLTLGDAIYRALVANGRTQGWHVAQQNHRVTQPANTELLIASFDFTVDYDFDVASS